MTWSWVARRFPSHILDSRVVVMRPTTTVNELREVSRSWESVRELRVHVAPHQSGVPSPYSGAGLEHQPTHKLWCAWDADLRPGDQVLMGDVAYEVLEVYRPGGIKHHQEAWLRRWR